MIRIMILNVKKFDIVCLEFEHVCLDFKGIYERGARGCYSFTVQLRSCNIDLCISKPFFGSVHSWPCTMCYID